MIDVAVHSAPYADEMNSLEVIAEQFKANVEVKDRKYRFQVGARVLALIRSRYDARDNFASFSLIFAFTRHTTSASSAKRQSITWSMRDSLAAERRQSNSARVS